MYENWNWSINPTMEKLADMYPVNFGTPEGQELLELINGMKANCNGTMDIVMLANYAYTLGMARGKQIERDPGQQADQKQKAEFVSLWQAASPELQEAITRIFDTMENEPFNPGTVKQILTECNVEPETIARFNEAYPDA